MGWGAMGWVQAEARVAWDWKMTSAAQPSPAQPSPAQPKSAQPSPVGIASVLNCPMQHALTPWSLMSPIRLAHSCPVQAGPAPLLAMVPMGQFTLPRAPRLGHHRARRDSTPPPPNSLEPLTSSKLTRPSLSRSNCLKNSLSCKWRRSDKCAFSLPAPSPGGEVCSLGQDMHVCGTQLPEPKIPAAPTPSSAHIHLPTPSTQQQHPPPD